MTLIIHDAMVYVGANSFKGRIQECTLPDMEFDVIGVAALGLLGEQEFVGSLKPMGGSMTLWGYDPDLLELISNPRKSETMLLRGSQEVTSASGVLEEKPISWTMQPRFPKQGGGKLNDKDGLTREFEFTTSTLLVQLAGAEILRVDVEDYVYAINGTNVFKAKRDNFGFN